MTPTEIVAIVTGALGGLLAFVTLARFFGGRWRSELEAASLQLARREATLVEKDKLIVGQSERLKRLDSQLHEQVQEMMGSRAFNVLLEIQKENAERFERGMAEASGIFTRIVEHIDAGEERQREALEAHERRADERHRALLHMVDQILDRCNGKTPL